MYNSILEDIYSEYGTICGNDFGMAYSHRCVRDEFNYKGPLPSSSELLLVGNYLIMAFIGEAIDGSNIYCVKPFTKLTIEEKSTAIIISGQDILNETI